MRDHSYGYTIMFFVGIGINVSNSLPTTCLNDMMPGKAKFAIEDVIAMTLNKFECELMFVK